MWQQKLFYFLQGKWAKLSPREDFSAQISIIKQTLCLEEKNADVIVFLLNVPFPAFIFGHFHTDINTILQQINVKNVHPVYGAGIQTHSLQYMSLLP